MVHYDQRKHQFKQRPHLQTFLKEVSEDWEIIVFTAALKDYANWILNDIDPSKYVNKRLYRDSCTFRRGTYLKDLSRIGKDLTKTVIVDNLPENFSMQPHNGIAIKSWFNDNQNDKELLKLSKVLKGLVGLADVREGIKNIGGRINVRKTDGPGSPMLQYSPNHQRSRLLMQVSNLKIGQAQGVLKPRVVQKVPKLNSTMPHQQYSAPQV